MSLVRLWPAFLGLAACAFLLACHLRWIEEPWENSMAGYNSGVHYGKTCQVWEAHGALRCRLRPTAFSSTGFFEPYVGYLNHPPTPYFLVFPAWKHLGRDERAMRIPILLLLALSMFWLHRAVSRSGESGCGWTALALYGSLPILIAHGNIVDAPLFSTVFLIPAVAAWMKWRHHPDGRGYLAYAAFGYLGGITDWFGYFVVPALWLDLLLARPGARGLLKTAFLTGLPFGLGLLSYLGWLAWADSEQFASILAFLGETADPTTHASMESRLAATQIMKGLGVPHAVAAAAGLLVVLARLLGRRLDRADRTALALFVAGVLPTIVFFVRVHDHEFWSITAAPGVAALGARALVLLRGAPRIGVSAAAVLTVIAVVLGARSGTELHDSYRSTLPRDRMEILNEYVGSKDVVLRPHGLGPDTYYLEAMTIPLVTRREYFDFALNNLRPARHTMGRMFVLWSTEITDSPEWVTELPLLEVTQVPWKPHGGVLFEVDKERAFAEID